MTKKNKDYKVLSEKEIEKCVEEFREWMKTQENFPQDIESTLIVRYLNIFHYQKDRAQRLFKNALEYRAKHPKLFVNRHPRSPAMMKVIDQFDMIPLLKNTKDNKKICIFRLLDTDPNSIVLSDCVKGYFMCCDFRFNLDCGKLSDIETGEIVIFDLKNLSLQHLTKLHLKTIKTFFTYLQVGHPIRLVQFHVINCSSLIDKIVFLCRPFINAKLFETLKIHRSGSLDSLYEYVPKELLPSDYGGPQPSMSELKEYYMNILHNKQDFFNNDEHFALKKTE